MDKQGVAEHHLALDCLWVSVGQRVSYEVPEQRADDRLALRGVGLENGVPIRQHPVPELQRGLDALHRLLLEDVGLAAGRLQVGMVAQEWVHQHCNLVPSDSHLIVWMLEEPTHVSTHKRLPSQGQCTDHCNGRLQMLPLGIVVTCPNCRVLVGADEEGTCQHKRPVSWDAHGQTLEGGAMHVIAVHVVDIAVLHHPMRMDHIPGHGNLRPVEHGRLVHVVPNVGVGVRALVLVQGKLGPPVVPHLRIREVRVARRARPAPPLIVRHGRVGIVDLTWRPLALVVGVVDLWSHPGAIFGFVPLLRLHRGGIIKLLYLAPVSRLHVRWIVDLLPG
mmetsp:Transcript_13386/g.24003  ORF Transcript_13386/g.24003 Transcript_13386/m.24003 type:complete len:333 (+) Transcript_13386:605-1603(+)